MKHLCMATFLLVMSGSLRAAEPREGIGGEIPIAI
jgi:hypothetical protein